MNTRKEKIMKSKWGSYVLDANIWKESHADVRDFTDIELNEQESGGILSERMIEASLSFLTTTPEDERYAPTKCDLRNMNLKDITELRHHRRLQYLDLSHNNLSDLSPLGQMPHLLYFKASHNQLQDILKFTAPWYLTYVNLSHNKITSMNDLREFWSIVWLDLSHNSIETISGLQNLKYLKHLNLSYNFIECVQNLDNLHIQELNLEYNCISKLISAYDNGINTLPNLRTFILGHNRLSSLEFFKNAYCLRSIDLKYNKLLDLMEVSNLSHLVYKIDLRGNSCTKWPNYKEVLLSSMPNLMFIDGDDVTISEKVSAEITFIPPIDLLASRGLTKLILLDQLSIPKVRDSDIPYDQVSPPLIILSGPSAVKKSALGLHVSETMPRKVKYCRSHTTREFSMNHNETKAYYFVEREEFNKMARNGEFLTVEELVGDSYGFHRREIAALRMENKIGITQMDLQATIQMKTRYPSAKIILVVAENEEIHRHWIEDKFKVFNWIKDSVENLWALSIGKRPSDPYIESMTSKINFVSDLLRGVIDSMDIPSYATNVRPQGTATTTDIIQQSKTMLPKLKITRHEWSKETKHIKFQSVLNIEDVNGSSLRNNASDLKVILDEDNNIIIDDYESKRQRMRERMLRRRTLTQTLDDSDDYTSESSIESTESLSSRYKSMDVDPKNLMNMYVEIVLKSTRMYIDQHLNNPGYYSLVMYSDDFNVALASLKDFIHEEYIKHPLKKAPKIPELEYLNRFVFPNKIEEIVDQLKARRIY